MSEAAYVYLLRRPVGSPAYIGVSRRPAKSSGLSPAVRDLRGAVCEVIAGPIEREAAFALQRKLIAYHGRAIDGGCLLNASVGGRQAGNGCVPSAEHREKLRRALKGKPRSAAACAALRAGWAARRARLSGEAA